MYLAQLRAENFRIFGANSGSEEAGAVDRPPLDLRLSRGVNVLVGENDSGKTAIVDAIRLCLLTRATDYTRVTQDDFHSGSGGRATTLTITCGFEDLTVEEQAVFLEMLTTVNSKPSLFVTLKAQLLDPLQYSRVSITTRTGPDGTGPALDGAAREYLKATYLKPLRDAEAELRAGRGSRLSQILAGYPAMRAQERSDFDEEADTAETLVGILRRAEHHIRNNEAVAAARDDINTGYLSKFAIGTDELRGEIGVSDGHTSLARALERLELRLVTGSDDPTKRGLGYDNALFMAAELLLLGNTGAATAPLLLIEEPEAHLHPQLQARVMDLLKERAGDAAGGAQVDSAPVQVILTTHSPNLASALPVHCLTMVARGRTFSLSPDQTRLEAGDYAFLSRFLDTTKANMFFARAVAVVEGDAEAIFLPALALAIGRSFHACGVSVVNVGHTGLFRYSRVFQRDGAQIPVAVACIRDRDLVPQGTSDEMRKKLRCSAEMTPAEIEAHVNGLTKEDDGHVRTFVSEHWTLEYDLAAASWTMATLMHKAVLCARASETKWPAPGRLEEIEKAAEQQVSSWQDAGRSLRQVALDVYKPLRLNNASKSIAAQHAARLLATIPVDPADIPKYLTRAFDHLCGEV